MLIEFETKVKGGLPVIVEADITKDCQGWNYADIVNIRFIDGQRKRSVPDKLFEEIVKYDIDKLRDEAIVNGVPW